MPRFALAGALLLFLFACQSGARPGPSEPEAGAREAAAEPGAEEEPSREIGPPSAPEGYVQMDAVGVASGQAGGGQTQAVGLMDPERTVVIPIFIGGTEALTIALRLHGQPFTRPLTHDLFDAALEELGAEPWKVQVDDLIDGVFHGSVFLKADGRIIELDARPSDAIAMAIGHEVPIYVAQKVIDRAGQPADVLLEQKGGEDTREMPPAPDLPEKRKP